MQEIIIYVFALAFFELYESSWQSGTTLQEILANIHTRYQKGLLYFFFSHPSFIYSLYLGIAYDLTNFWFLTLLFFKFMDISYKLVIVQKIEQKRLQEVLPISLNTPIQKWMSYMNVIIYPTLLYLAFLQS